MAWWDFRDSILCSLLRSLLFKVLDYVRIYLAASDRFPRRRGIFLFMAALVSDSVPAATGVRCAGSRPPGPRGAEGSVPASSLLPVKTLPVMAPDFA